MKKFLAWVLSIVIVLLVFGGGCFALAKYNTNSLAHSYYQKLTGKPVRSSKRLETAYKVPVTMQKDKAASKVDSALKTNNLAGSTAIIRKGQLTYLTATGRSRYPGGSKNTNTTKYQIGSAQDLITAASVMKLSQQKKLKLSDKLSKYYPKISGAKQITVKNLLNMTSGLSITATPPATDSFPTLLSWNERNVQSSGQTGSYDYQAVNYVLLAGIIQIASDQPYREFIQTQVIDKLDLKNTGFVLNSTKRDKLATSYEDSYSGGKVEATGMAKVQSTKLGPYQMYMSTRDLATTYLYILSGKFIKSTNVDKLIGSSKPSFVGGVYSGKNYFTVHGQLGGYQDSVQIDAGKQNGVVLLTNYVPTGIKNTQTAPIIYNTVFK
ncbi:serine hydrolase domain-containing protein [Pediococcus inopinatus]|uniref:serine hydrolase domain-containing protein n=1 Tax=Pediococcus inopinatus TaxID=114090 RepID=UPI002A6A0985|nr:serine hydrolase domain-containing protein [Pediococcus inopinatus]WPP08695.1 serine hydrolase domain-containing protein [Pediococcus inopinatus]